ncbi:MAG: hypothetical protein ABIK73_06800 [candidate division WOR-3 bacterium]
MNLRVQRAIFFAKMYKKIKQERAELNKRYIRIKYEYQQCRIQRRLLDVYLVLYKAFKYRWFTAEEAVKVIAPSMGFTSQYFSTMTYITRLRYLGLVEVRREKCSDSGPKGSIKKYTKKYRLIP